MKILWWLRISLLFLLSVCGQLVSAFFNSCRCRQKVGYYCGTELDYRCVPWNLYLCNGDHHKAIPVASCRSTCVYRKGTSYCL